MNDPVDLPPAGSAPSTLQISLLGEPGWRHGADKSGPLSRQDAALIAILALRGPQARDVLAGQIWPDIGIGSATNNLRQHIARLRRQTGHPVFVAGASVTLAEDIDVDVQHLADLDPQRLLEDDLLAGFDYTDIDLLDARIVELRERVSVERAEILASHAEALEKRHQLAAALRLSARIVELAPHREHAWRRLMRQHYLRGDRTAAIEAFERFEEHCREIGAYPDPETIRLLETIERGQKPAAEVAPVIPVSLVHPPVRIGRDADWQRMQGAWAAGRCFVVVGDAGIGKSRLLMDFAHERSGVVFEHGRPGDAEAPFTVLARLLQAVVVAHGAQVGDFTRQELARLVPGLGTAPQAAATEANLRRASEDLLRAAVAHGLTALVVDDLHFVDLATLEWLRWISAGTELDGLRLGLATRPIADGPAGDLVRAWMEDPRRPERIDVLPLARGDIADLLGTLDLPQADVPSLAVPDLAARLHAHAGGHPMLTLETLKAAYLHRRDAGDDLPRPQSVQALLDRRLRDLGSAAIDLLRVAAICGPDLTMERAAKLLGMTTLAIADAWSQLERANVLQEERFAHDLVLDSAQRLVPGAMQRVLHADVAALLRSDPGVAPARVAGHWEAAERWSEAGECWQAAGVSAKLGGRLVEQQALLARAAECHRRAGNRAGQFEAVRAGFDGMLLRLGGTAVLDALPRLEALASTPRDLLLCGLIRGETLVDLERSSEAFGVTTGLVRAATDQHDLLADALCLHAMATVQIGAAEDAIDLARRAVEAARSAGLQAQELRAVNAQAYVLYAAGNLGESIPVQRRALVLAEAIGDRAEALAAEGNLAALLGAAGDVPGSYDHALLARGRCVTMGLSSNSTFASINLVVLGTAAAYMGRYDEALDALLEAQRLAGPEASVGTQSKVRIALASLWLTLGCSEAARALVVDLPDGTIPGMQMQAALILAQADALDGQGGEGHFARLGELMRRYPDLPVVQSAWVEWSYQGDARAVIDRLREVRAQFERLGLQGTARTVLLREIDRLNELSDPDATRRAAACAAELLPHVEGGLSAKTYPPEAWFILSRAFATAGESARSRTCLAHGRRWVEERARTRVPKAYHQSFLERNPVNRSLTQERS